MHQILRWCVLLTALGLDFFHLSEHVNEARRSSFGEDSAPGRQWAGEALHRVKHQGYEPFWQTLVQWRSKLRPPRRKEADRLLHYVSDRREMIQYDRFEEQGWRISSAPTESECGVVPTRVKGGSRRWDGDHVEGIMALEGLDQSHLWRPYWTTCAWQNN